MEGAIKTLVTTFLSYTKGKENLDSKTFKKMVQQQCSSIMEDTDSSSSIKEMQRGLDDNSDGKVSFQEYMTLIGYLAEGLSKRKASDSQEAS